MTSKTRNAGEIVADALRGLQPLFKEDVNLTFIMTHPKIRGCYMVITTAEIDRLIEAINDSRTPASEEISL